MLGQMNSRLCRIGATFLAIAVLSWVTWSPSMRAANRIRGTAESTTAASVSTGKTLSVPRPHYHALAASDPITSEQALMCIAFMLSPVFLVCLAPMLAILSGNVAIGRPQLRVVGTEAVATPSRRSGHRRHAVA